MLLDRINSLLPYIKTGGHRIKVPHDLKSITTINKDRECSPESLGRAESGGLRWPARCWWR